MQIRFQVTGSSPLSLAGTGREAEQDFRLSFADQLQVIAPLRSAAATTVNRGNRIYSASWTTVRQHTTAAAADAFLLNHAAEIPPGETGTLTLLGGTGGASTSTSLINATVAITASNRLGVSTFTTYSAQGAAE